MADTEIPARAYVAWRAIAVGQDNNDPGSSPEDIPLAGVRVRLTPSPRKIEVGAGGIDGTLPLKPTTYTLRDYDLTTTDNGDLVNSEDPDTAVIEIVASDAIPGVTIEWTSTISAPDTGVPDITKVWLAPTGETVDLTTVASIPPSPSPLADYLQAVADARAARDITAALATQVRADHDEVKVWRDDAVEAAVDAAAAAAAAPPVFDSVAGEYDPASLSAWLTRQRDGQIYGIQIPKGLATACTKTAANAGIATPTPGVIGTPAVDPYRDRGPFFYREVNGYVTPDGVPHVTAFDGDATFSKTGSNGDVWILAPNLFWRFSDNGADSVTISISDVSRPGFEVQPKGKLPDGTRRPYMLYAKYALSLVDGTPRSISGQPIANRTISHNSLLTICNTATTGYSGWSYADKWYLDTMFLLKYATKNFQSIFAGCTSHSQQYAPAVAETGVKRVIVTTAQAANFPVGSEIMLGTNTPTTTLRNAAQLYDVIASAKITGKEVVGSNTALLLGDLASPIDTATTQLLSTAPWRTGACDAVVGDGSPYNPLSGREPVQIQGIGDLLNGAYSLIGDLILSNVGAGWEPCLVLDSRNADTSVTAAYKRSGKYLPTDDTDSWKYPLYPECVDGLLLGTTVGASSSTGLCDGHYTNKSSTLGVRVWRACGGLTSGGIAGLWCIFGTNGLSDGGWDVASRLSANGRAS